MKINKKQLAVMGLFMIATGMSSCVITRANRPEVEIKKGFVVERERVPEVEAAIGSLYAPEAMH